MPRFITTCAACERGEPRVRDSWAMRYQMLLTVVPAHPCNQSEAGGVGYSHFKHPALAQWMRTVAAHSQERGQFDAADEVAAEVTRWIYQRASVRGGGATELQAQVEELCVWVALNADAAVFWDRLRAWGASV